MRRHDLDWLRVLAFSLLLFYHAGMLFVPWGFHIKNNVTYDWLTYPMWFLNQWRLPLLFMISGMGTFFALKKRSTKEFVWERIKRLYFPLVFGMLVIIPPQVYVERLVRGQFDGKYLDFWPMEALIGVYPSGNFSWHHLWFLPYLLVFSLLLIPVFRLLMRNSQRPFISWVRSLVKNPVGIYLFIVPLYLIETLVEPFFPVTHALVDDWFNFLNSLTLFFFGFLLISVGDEFWNTAERYRLSFLIAGIVFFSSMLGLVNAYEDSTARHFTEGFLKVANLWSWILALFGFASRHLNKPSALLSYCNQAVYPFYILHQSVMLVIAYFIIDLDASFGLKMASVFVGMLGISWMIYELGIRRWKIIRPLFGLKSRG